MGKERTTWDQSRLPSASDLRVASDQKLFACFVMSVILSAGLEGPPGLAGCILEQSLHLTQGWPGARVRQMFVDWLNELVAAQEYNPGKSSRPALGAPLTAVHTGAPRELHLFCSLLFPRAQKSADI